MTVGTSSKSFGTGERGWERDSVYTEYPFEPFEFCIMCMNYLFK